MSNGTEKSSGRAESAEEWIARCKAEAWDVVDLNDRGLRVLPESLRDITSMLTLNLRNNALEELPEWMAEF